jgi:hypothetical protein
MAASRPRFSNDSTTIYVGTSTNDSATDPYGDLYAITTGGSTSLLGDGPRQSNALRPSTQQRGAETRSAQRLSSKRLPRLLRFSGDTGINGFSRTKRNLERSE